MDLAIPDLASEQEQKPRSPSDRDLDQDLNLNPVSVNLSTLNLDLDLDVEEGQQGQMRKLIECPVCLEIPLPPIFLCERGHIVCNDCQRMTQACPLCRGFYSKTRSFVAEGIVENCMLKCKHAEQGCPKVMKGSQLVQHLKTCDYRPIYCVDCNNPESLISFKEYTGHLINVHKINGVRESSGFVLYNMDLTRRIQDGIRYCWPPYYFIDEDQNTFLIRMHVSSAFVCSWVSYVGPKENCAKFQITIEFHVPRVCLERNENKRRFSLVWKGEANHFREDSYKEVFQNGTGLTIPAETVKEVGKVSEVLSEWLYHIQIINIQKHHQQAESSPRPVFVNTNNNNNGPTSASAGRKSCSRSKSQNPKVKEREKSSAAILNSNGPSSSSFPSLSLQDQHQQGDSLLHVDNNNNNINTCLNIRENPSGGDEIIFGEVNLNHPQNESLPVPCSQGQNQR